MPAHAIGPGVSAPGGAGARRPRPVAGVPGPVPTPPRRIEPRPKTKGTSPRRSKGGALGIEQHDGDRPSLADQLGPLLGGGQDLRAEAEIVGDDPHNLVIVEVVRPDLALDELLL